jgi:hypothetical protein
VRPGFLLLLGLLSPGPLAAQTVMRPAPPLDSARAAVRDAVLVLRDSLITIDGAAARLQRDFRNASGPSLLSRASVMYEACARSTKAIPVARKALESTQLTEPARIKHRQELLAELDRLRTAVGRCETEFAAMSKPGQAETVRGYANDRAIRLQGALRNYERVLRDYLGVMGIRMLPLGATRSTAT